MKIEDSESRRSFKSELTITQIRDQIWNEYVRQLIMDNEFGELGIDVSDEEFFELLQGVNASRNKGKFLLSRSEIWDS